MFGPCCVSVANGVGHAPCMAALNSEYIIYGKGKV